MIKESNIQPLKILNVADFLNGEITVKKVFPRSAVELFIKHRNANGGKIRKGGDIIRKALDNVRAPVPRYAVNDFIKLVRRTV
jgi:hypothetical protein